MAISRIKNWLFVLALLGYGMANAQEPDMSLLTGDTRLACEAILCLSTGQRPSECQPSIKRYFSIVKRTTSKTLRARRDFLKQCPAAKEDDHTRNLVNALVDSSGRCDAAALNGRNWTLAGGDNGYYVSNAMPASCHAYYGNTGLDVGSAKPIYVGTPSRGGFWVDPAHHAQALASYNARIAQEDLERARSTY